MNPIPRAEFLVCALLLLVPVTGLAKSSDRNQPMSIENGNQDGSFEGSGTIQMSQGVSVQQGSLDIRSDSGQVVMRDGQISRVVFSGSPVTLKQQMEDGSPMTATASRVDYDMINDVVTFTGNYTVKSPKGSNSGQKMVYNLKTGNMQSGGDGTRVKTVIQPKAVGPSKKSGESK